MASRHAKGDGDRNGRPRSYVASTAGVDPYADEFGSLTRQPQECSRACGLVCGGKAAVGRRGRGKTAVVVNLGQQQRGERGRIQRERTQSSTRILNTQVLKTPWSAVGEKRIEDKRLEESERGHRSLPTRTPHTHIDHGTQVSPQGRTMDE